MDRENREVANRLKLLSQKHVETTMIGALSAVEEILGELWNHKSKNKTEEEQGWYNRYEELRSRILDTGNKQKRKMEEEFEHFDIKLRLYRYQMQVKARPRGTNEGNIEG